MWLFKMSFLEAFASSMVIRGVRMLVGFVLAGLLLSTGRFGH